MPVSDVERRALGKTRRYAAHEGLSHPVQHDGNQGDGNALLHGLSDLQLLQRKQELLAKPRGTDQRRDHRHGQGLHDGLIEAKQQCLLRGGQLDLPQKLARRAPRHAAGFKNFGGHRSNA